MKSLKSKLNYLAKELKAVRAKDIMTKSIITTTQEATLTDVAVLMTKKRISGLPVVDRGKKIKGIITATDLFLVMDMIKYGDIIENDFMRVSNPTVKFAMSTEVVKIKKNTSPDKIISPCLFIFTVSVNFSFQS